MPLAPGPAAQHVPPGRLGYLLAGIALSPGGLLGGHLAGPMPGVQIGSIAGTIGSLLLQRRPGAEGCAARAVEKRGRAADALTRIER